MFFNLKNGQVDFKILLIKFLLYSHIFQLFILVMFLYFQSIDQIGKNYERLYKLLKTK
jgi:hypothetical protein